MFLTTLTRVRLPTTSPAALELLDAAHIQAHRRVELQSAAAGSGLRVAVHNADLFAELVDEDGHTVGFADGAGQLAQTLGHQTSLNTHMAVAHLALDLGLGDHRCHRVH